ncbi:MAG: hypothetical protein KDJ90_00485 [Nitratireductor sp.]|nr:hypothetical protein [Nitratireductor sp.]
MKPSTDRTSFVWITPTDELLLKLLAKWHRTTPEALIHDLIMQAGKDAKIPQTYELGEFEERIG